MFEKIMRKFVKWIDPHLERYRAKKAPAPKYVPRTLEEFIGVLQRTPKSILSAKDRERIVAVMSFDERRVEDLMAGKEQIVFVKKDEMLGPLTLDKLYKSGFTSFPVVDSKEKVVGTIHTEALNALEIKKTDRADKYIDRKVNYLKMDDTLSTAVEEIERTSCYYFLVTDGEGRLVGCFTIQMLLEYLVGKV